jgi:hypothetical protein
VRAPNPVTDLVHVAAALGWRIIQEPGTFGGVHLTPSERSDGYGVHTWKRPNQDRYEFSVSHPPRSAEGWYYTLRYGEHMPSISVRANRSPDAIAREITRRLLPAYDAVWAHYLEAKAEYDAYVGQTLDTVARIAGALGVADDGPNGRGGGDAQRLFRVGNCSDAGFYGDVTVRGNHATFDLRVSEVGLAERIARVLADAKAGTPETEG